MAGGAATVLAKSKQPSREGWASPRWSCLSLSRDILEMFDAPRLPCSKSPPIIGSNRKNSRQDVRRSGYSSQLSYHQMTFQYSCICPCPNRFGGGVTWATSLAWQGLGLWSNTSLLSQSCLRSLGNNPNNSHLLSTY